MAFYEVKHRFKNKNYPNIKRGDIVELDKDLARLVKDCIKKIPEQKATVKVPIAKSEPETSNDKGKETKETKKPSRIQELSGVTP